MTLQLRINKIQIFHKPTRHKLESVGTIKSLETIHKPRSLGTKFIILILFMIKKKKNTFMEEYTREKSNNRRQAKTNCKRVEQSSNPKSPEPKLFNNLHHSY